MVALKGWALLAIDLVLNVFIPPLLFDFEFFGAKVKNNRRLVVQLSVNEKQAHISGCLSSLRQDATTSTNGGGRVSPTCGHS